MNRITMTRLAALSLGLLLALTTQARQKAQEKNRKADHLSAAAVQGEPKDFQRGLTCRYAVWHDTHGWHLRTTTAQKKHRFKGHIEVIGGTFTTVRSFHLEKKGKLDDHWKLGPNRHRLTFDFETDEGMDGIDFHVSKDAKTIRFHLHIDGKDHVRHVFVGHAGVHPEHMPFAVPAHPGRKK